MTKIDDFFSVVSASGYAVFDGYIAFAESVDPAFNRAMSTSFAAQYFDQALKYLKSHAGGSFQTGNNMLFKYEMDFPYLKTNDVLNPAWKCIANFSNQDIDLYYELLCKKKSEWKKSDVRNFVKEIECANNSSKMLRSLLLNELKKYGFTKINECEWLCEVGVVSMILRPNINFRSRIAPFQFNIRYVSRDAEVYFFLEQVVPGLQAYTVHKDLCESSLYISSRLLIGVLVAEYLSANLNSLL